MLEAFADGTAARTRIDRARLLRTLADGRRHGWSDLAQSVFGHRDAHTIAQLRTALASDAWLGLPLEIDGSGVRASRFVVLDARDIARSLGDGWQARVVDETRSTNTDLLDDVRARPDRSLPALLAAEIQHGGRGRLGRRWTSVPGASLTVSFAIAVARRLAQLDGVTLVCGLAARRVFATHGVDARLKWPNDVLIDGRKVAGILVEAQARPSGTVLVVGIGVNLVPSADPHGPAGDPPSLRAGALTKADAEPIDRNRLAATLAVALQADVARFDRDGFATSADAWNAADAFRDRAVALHDAIGAVERGIARGVDETGALWLESDGVRRRFIAGELSLRPQAGEETT